MSMMMSMIPDPENNDSDLFDQALEQIEKADQLLNLAEKAIDSTNREEAALLMSLALTRVEIAKALGGLLLTEAVDGFGCKEDA